ncbi:hypothetical protein ACYPKM_00470 [Pseudomonas aeruginosa]
MLAKYAPLADLLEKDGKTQFVSSLVSEFDVLDCCVALLANPSDHALERLISSINALPQNIETLNALRLIEWDEAVHTPILDSMLFVGLVAAEMCEAMPLGSVLLITAALRSQGKHSARACRLNTSWFRGLRESIPYDRGSIPVLARLCSALLSTKDTKQEIEAHILLRELVVAATEQGILESLSDDLRPAVTALRDSLGSGFVRFRNIANSRGANPAHARAHFEFCCIKPYPDQKPSIAIGLGLLNEIRSALQLFADPVGAGLPDNLRFSEADVARLLKANLDVDAATMQRWLCTAPHSSVPTDYHAEKQVQSLARVKDIVVRHYGEETWSRMATGLLAGVASAGSLILSNGQPLTIADKKPMAVALAPDADMNQVIPLVIDGDPVLISDLVMKYRKDAASLIPAAHKSKTLARGMSL